MRHETFAEGPSVAEALDIALEELGVQQDAVEYEVVSEGGKRLFGIGSEKSAKVKVWIKDSFADELENAKKVAREILDVDEQDAEEDAPPPELRKDSFASKEPGDMTDEELDQVADEAVSSIQSVLQGFGIDASIEEYEGDDGEIILDIVGDDLGVLIGRHGRTLDAIQTLAAAITNRRIGYRYPILVDVEGYRNRRKVKLEEIGRRAADRAKRQGGAVKLRPMSSYERKVIHVALRDDVRVITASEGEEPFRQVVVRPRP